MSNKLSLSEIKEIELKILLEFHSFCKKNDLRYSLCGGSLLGAIRHKGFIPWDDDIDVFMPRPDYERLRELAGGTNKINEDYYLADWRFPSKENRKPFMYFPFLKLIDLKTEISSVSVSKKNYVGIWIDIFPIDGLPESESKTKRIYRRSWFWRQLFSLHYCEKIVAKGIVQKIIKIPFIPIARILKGEFFCKILDSLSSKYKYDECKYVGGIINGYGPQEKILKTELDAMEIEFEGHKICGICGYDTYLSNLYGNYMQLPPENQRICHSFDAWKIEP